MAALQMAVTNQSLETVSLNYVVLNATGTGNSETGITSVNLFKGSTLLVSGSYNGSGVVTLGGFPLDSLGASAAQTYMVTYDFSGTASTGIYTANLQAGVDLQGLGQQSGEPINVSGAPLDGGGDYHKRCPPADLATNTTTGTATNTATNTTTNTMTPTPTDSPTPTTTNTGNENT